MYLDVALRDESTVAVGEIRSADTDEKCVFARTGPIVVTGAYRKRNTLDKAASESHPTSIRGPNPAGPQLRH
jgi:hypothetical protein